MASHCLEFHKEYPSCLSFLYFFLNTILIFNKKKCHFPPPISLSNPFHCLPLTAPQIYGPFFSVIVAHIHIHMHKCEHQYNLLLNFFYKYGGNTLNPRVY